MSITSCSDDKGGDPASAAPPETTAPAATGSAPAGDADWVSACELLTDAEVTAVAGGTVAGASEVAPGDLDGCVWTGPGAAEQSDYRVTRVQRAIAGESAQIYLDTLDAEEQPQLVDGVGDGAVVWSDIFGAARAAIWDGDTVVFLFMSRGTAGEITRDDILPLVQSAGTRL